MPSARLHASARGGSLQGAVATLARRSWHAACHSQVRDVNKGGVMADAWKEAEKAAQRGVAAAQDDATRVAANATKRFGDLSKKGQELAREADQRIEEYTGRSSDAWIKEGSRFIKTRPWTAVAMVAVAAYLFGKLRG